MNFGQGVHRLFIVAWGISSICVALYALSEAGRHYERRSIWEYADKLKTSPDAPGTHRVVFEKDGLEIVGIPNGTPDDHPRIDQRARSARFVMAHAYHWSEDPRNEYGLIWSGGWAILAAVAWSAVLWPIALIVRWIYRGFVSEKT